MGTLTEFQIQTRTQIWKEELLRLKSIACESSLSRLACMHMARIFISLLTTCSHLRPLPLPLCCAVLQFMLFEDQLPVCLPQHLKQGLLKPQDLPHQRENRYQPQLRGGHSKCRVVEVAQLVLCLKHQRSLQQGHPLHLETFTSNSLSRMCEATAHPHQLALFP